jgi:glutathione S-transferase
MITLYHSPKTRADSIVWLLEELGVAYALRAVDWRRADGSGQRDAANPHPHGKIPALDDGRETVFETSAIALYLTDKYRDVPMGPLPGEPGRGAYLSWLAYRPGVLEPALICRRFNVQHVHGAMGWAPADEVEGVMNRHLANHEYFLGDTFSAVDILVGGGLHFMAMAGMIQQTPVIEAYGERITARSAFARMMRLGA